MTRSSDETPATPARADDTTAASTSVEAAPKPAPTGDRYVVGAEVGRGGIGRVLRARDRKLGRTVALKELLGGGRADAARFQREALLTARLQHPGIVPVYDAGERAGAPYYAMKLVGGRTLGDLIQAAASLRDRLALLPRVLAVAEALAYAHSEGVIHRDLKPSNVLVGEFGETLVIDWGLAKQVHGDEAASVDPEAAGDDAARPASSDDGLTVAGAVMGTPAYMSPEQAAGAAVDARADVYALGAMLYHLLAGVPPYRASSAALVIQRVTAGPPMALAECVPLAPRDLVSIAERAMSRDPAARYADASAVADDLRRFLTGQLVGAYRYSRLALLARWLRRNRTVVVVAAVLLTALAATATVSVRRILDERDRVARQRDVASRRGEQLRLLQASAALAGDPTAAVAWLRDLGGALARHDRDARVIASAAASRGVARHVLRGHTRGVARVAYADDGARLVSAGGDGVAIVWRRSPGAVPAIERRLVHPGAVRDAAFGPGGAWVVTVGDDGIVRQWDLADGEPRELHRHAPLGVVLAFARDGTVVTGGDDGQVLATGGDGAARAVPGHPGGVLAVAASADGGWLATAGMDGEVRIIEPDGALRLLPHPDLVLGLAFSPDGTTLATAGNDAVVRLWPVAGGAARVLDTPGDVKSLRFAADGRTLAAVEPRGTIVVWDVASGHGREIATGGGWIFELQFAPGGDALLAASKDGVARLVRLGDDDVRALTGHQGPVTAAAFAPAGDELATAGDDGVIRLWQASATTGVRAAVHGGELRRLVAARDVPVFAAGARDGSVSRWEAGVGLTWLHRAGNEIGGLAIAADGRRVAFADYEGVVTVHDAGAASARPLGKHDGGVTWLALDAGARVVATAGFDGRILLWSVDPASPRALIGHQGAVFHVAFSADGSSLASAGTDGTVRWWDVAAGTSRVLGHHRGTVMRAVPVPGGAQVISVGEDGAVRLWTIATGAATVLGTHDGLCGDVAVSDDGRRAVTASWDGTIGLWDLVAGAGVRIDGHGSGVQVNAVALSADGRTVVSAGEDGAVRVWSWDGAPARALIGHTGFVTRLALTHDGARLASGGADGVLRVWDAPLAADPATVDLPGWLDALTTAAVTERGAIASPLAAP